MNFSIYTAFPRGYCAWVHRAVGMLMEIVSLYPPPIYVNHEIIHNTFVVRMWAGYCEDTYRKPRCDIRAWNLTELLRTVAESRHAMDRCHLSPRREGTPRGSGLYQPRISYPLYRKTLTPRGCLSYGWVIRTLHPHQEHRGYLISPPYRGSWRGYPT